MNASRILRPGLELLLEPHSVPLGQLGVSVSAQFIVYPSYVLLQCVEIPFLVDIGKNIDRESVGEHLSQMIPAQVATVLCKWSPGVVATIAQGQFATHPPWCIEDIDKEHALGNLHLNRHSHAFHVHRTPQFKPVEFLTTS